jgi:hypothetical protein
MFGNSLISGECGLKANIETVATVIFPTVDAFHWLGHTANKVGNSIPIY